MLFNDHFLAKLNKGISLCEKCSLSENAGPVIGYGQFDADVMFISDVPGKIEIQTGVPFTGKAKEKMVEYLKDAELKKEDYYFTYLIKHRINSRVDMIKNTDCKYHLLKEIELVNPRIICSMGFFVTKAIMAIYKAKERHDNLSDIHGQGLILPRRLQYGKLVRPKRYLVPTYNPNSDNPVINMSIKEDIKMIPAIRKLSPALFEKTNIGCIPALTRKVKKT